MWRTPARIAWLALGSAATLAFLVFGTYAVIGLLAHEEHREVAEVHETVTVLEVDNTGGSVRVATVPEGPVRVTASISEGLRSPDTTRVLDGERLVLTGGCPEFAANWCGVDFLVEVPEGVEVRARAGHGGITLTGRLGAVDARAEHGSIDVSGLAGPAALATRHGAIRGADLRSGEVRAETGHGTVALDFLDAPHLVEARTGHGGIDVVLPDDDATYRVEPSTGHGDHFSRVRTDPDADRIVRLRTGHGDINTRYGH